MVSLISVRHVLLVLAVPALMAPGCGGMPSNGDPAASDARALKWVQCMQQHGVTAFESNDGHSTGVRAPAGSGGGNGAGEQKVRAAQEACKQYSPNGGAAPPTPTAQQMDQLNKYAQCMNQLGVPTQVGSDGGIQQQPGPAGPAQQDQADQQCKHLLPNGGQ